VPTKEISKATNAFIGRPTQPSDAQLAAALGPSKRLWDQLIGNLTSEFSLDEQEWNSYSSKAGWSLRLKRKKRNILHMAPLQGSFQIALILGDKAIQAARRCGLPKPILKMIAEAKRYPEGTAIRMQVRNEKDLAVIRSLAAIKVQN
jgi:Protein of unknown function (DUF3788)